MLNKALVSWILHNEKHAVDCVISYPFADDVDDLMRATDIGTPDRAQTQSVDDMDVTDGSESNDDETRMEVSEDDFDDSLDINDDEVYDDWMEDVNDSPIDALPDQEMVNELLKKCRGLISMIKRSTIITAFFDMLRTKLSIRRNLCYDVKTRWNSTFCLIDSFLALRETIERLFDAKHDLHIKRSQLEKLSGLELKSDDWTTLLQLHYVLQPFFHATRAMSGRAYPSIGFTYYLIMRLKAFLQNSCKKDNIIVKRLKKLLLTQLTVYFENDDEQLALLNVSKLRCHR